MKEFEKFFYWFCFKQHEFGIKKLPNGGTRAWIRWSDGEHVTFEDLYKQYKKEENNGT